MGALASMGLGLARAGEPIRFIPPKAGEKAPLRVNFAAEKARALETPSASSVQASMSVSGQSAGAAGPANRRSRSATARGSWASEPENSKVDTRQLPRPEMQETSQAGRSGGPAGSVFGTQPLMEDPTVDRRTGLGMDNRAALRSLTAGGYGADRSGLGRPDVSRSGPLGLPSANPANPSAPGPSASAPSLLGSDALRNGGSGADASGPSTPRGTPSSPFDPANRPFHSSFDLPTRPR